MKHLFFLILLSINSYATTYYVATNGASGNTGLSTSSPWPLAWAVTHAGQSNTIIIQDGNYTNNLLLNSPSTMNGLQIKAANKWKAVLYGASGANLIDLQSGVCYVTFDGLQVCYSYYSNFKIERNCNSNTVRNCWIHHAGRGNPSWTTNTTASYSGQGIYNTGYSSGTTFEYNLVEHNGAWLSYDHGIYMSGTNHIIRNNVVRYNLAYGIQIWNDAIDNCSKDIKIYNNLVYNNGYWLTPFDGECITVSVSGYTNNLLYTNYVFNNVLISNNKYAVHGQQYVALTNNIIISPLGFDVYSQYGGTFWVDYNLLTNTVNTSTSVISGGHNRQNSTNVGFLSPGSNGLFWLTSTSDARGMAYSAAAPPVDFFGNAQSSVTDVGPFQYSATLAADVRDLDPSDPILGADYWKVLSAVDITISSQPASTTVGCGSTATFSVSASGGSTLSYQWYLNGSPVGSNSSSYTTPATDATYNGASVYVVVTDTSGSLQSSTATLTVTGCSGGTTTTTKKTLGSRNKGRGTL